MNCAQRLPCSVVIITRNEAAKIADCLASVAWADEVIVLDGSSSDQTVAIAEDLGAKVFSETEWLGFGIQKQRAVSHASHDWILSLDADERISDALREEIEQVLRQPKHSGYFIPRLSSYCGAFIHHSGWRPDYVLRLFNKTQGGFNDAKVHEKVELTGSTERLRNDIIHYSFDDLETVLHKVNHYSTLGAEKMYAKGKRCGLGTALIKGWWAFMRTWVLQRGFLDGREGLMLALSNAEGTYYKYAKLALMSRKAQP